MRFDLTDEQKQLQDTLETLFAATFDSNQLANVDDAAIAVLRRENDDRLAGIGLHAVLTNVAHGGLDLGLLTLAAAAEVIGRHAAPTSAIANALASWLIASAGSEAQKARWLEPLLTGQSNAAFAVDDGQGCDPTRIAMKPSAKLRGRKFNVEGGQSADLLIVALSGGALALVRDVDAEAEPLPPLDRTRPTSTLTFANAAFEPLAATPETLRRLYDAHSILLAADAYGAGARALEMSVEYAKSRVQFGRPIGANQGLKHQLANMCASFSPTRFLPWYAAHAWDTMQDAPPRAAALAKAHVPSTAVALARAAVELHGAIGYTWEYPLHLFLKRAMYDQAAWCDATYHRARAAASAGW